jgi:acetone carboxylase gamma subunit
MPLTDVNAANWAKLCEWLCPDCGAHNEATRLWCRVCGWIRNAGRWGR